MILGMACVAAVLVVVWGPVGLVLLGLMTLLVCTRFSLDEEMPTWGKEVFAARMTRPGSPEQRAAMIEERRAVLSPLRFYRWCGIILVICGAAGLGWQHGR